MCLLLSSCSVPVLFSYWVFGDTDLFVCVRQNLCGFITKIEILFITCWMANLHQILLTLTHKIRYKLSFVRNFHIRVVRGFDYTNHFDIYFVPL